MRKCGTRALLEMLYLHPRIQKAAGEVHFFDRDENYWKGLEWYRKKMPHSFRGQITIEKSPSYFVTPEVRAESSMLDAAEVRIVSNLNIDIHNDGRGGRRAGTHYSVFIT